MASSHSVFPWFSSLYLVLSFSGVFVKYSSSLASVYVFAMLRVLLGKGSGCMYGAIAKVWRLSLNLAGTCQSIQYIV